MPKRLTIFEFEGNADDLLQAKREVIDPVIERKGPQHGFISHVTAKSENGLIIVNLWESEEGSEKAFQDPDIQEARRQMEERVGSAPPQARHYEVTDYRTG